MYFGTVHEGLFVFEGSPQRYEPKRVLEAASGAGNSGEWR